MSDCAGQKYPWSGPCDGPAVRERENAYSGCMEHFCSRHDPVRIENEKRDRAGRRAGKRARWKAMERAR